MVQRIGVRASIGFFESLKSACKARSEGKSNPQCQTVFLFVLNLDNASSYFVLLRDFL